MSLLAIVSVAGVIFAFNNFNPPADAYAGITIEVNNSNIELEIEVEKDNNNEFVLKDADERYTVLQITVGGLPDTADRGVTLNKTSLSSGVVDIPQEGFNQAAGISQFLIRANKGGSTKLIFTTNSGQKKIEVNVNVILTAKYFELKDSSSAHFGVRQGGDPLDFRTSGTLSKFNFFAHPDGNGIYKPNNFPVTYRLAEDYEGVELDEETKQLSVNDNFVFEDGSSGRVITILGQLPAMAESDQWVEIPVYVFKPASALTVATGAFVADPSIKNQYDLILNRDQISAVFNFAFPEQGTLGEDYDVYVDAVNTMLKVIEQEKGEYVISGFSDNYGITPVTITAKPHALMLIGNTWQDVWFDKDADANVWIKEDITIRLRNEFISETETILINRWKLEYSKNKLNAFFNDGNTEYADEFTLNTGNGKPINYENEITFKLLVNYKDGTTETLADDDLSKVLNLQIKNNDGEWVSLASVGGKAYYNSQFSVSAKPYPQTLKYMTDKVTSMYLRAESVSPLSINDPQYATYDVPLQIIGAIDQLDVKHLVQQDGRPVVTDLTQFDTETIGVALVHHQDSNEPSTVQLVAYGRIQTNQGLEYSTRWQPSELTTNTDIDLPFRISPADSTEIIDGQIISRRIYTLILNNNANVEYYTNYPLTIRYATGEAVTINVKILPTVTQVVMNVSSNNYGRVYRTIANPENNEYLGTVFVSQGANYHIDVETPNVSVGAGTVFVDENGVTRLDFDANCAEDVYQVTVRLTAYSPDVYVKHDLEFTVNFVVIQPVSNVPSFPLITLGGIGDKYTLDFTPTDGYTGNLYVKPIVTDPHVQIKPVSGSNVNYEIIAEYLTDKKDETITLGFRIYKYFKFDQDFDGDGKNDEFELQYTAGLPLSVDVRISDDDKFDDIYFFNAAGNESLIAEGANNYVMLISDPQASTTVNVATMGNSTNTALDYAIVEWNNGNYDLTKPLSIDAINCLDSVSMANNVVTLVPTAGVRNLAAYALVVYAKNSLRLVEVIDDKAIFVPDTYTIAPLYFGTSDQIKTIIDDIKNNVIHDANSGVMNNYGGYNWIIGSSGAALLFYTPYEDNARPTHTSGIIANRYYLDDLATVLNWGDVFDGNNFTFLKYINNTVATAMHSSEVVGVENNRYYIQLHDYTTFAQSDDETDHVVKYVLRNENNGKLATFYVVEGIKTFDVKRVMEDQSTLVTKTLAAAERNAVGTSCNFTVRRGQPFELQGKTNTAINSGWNVYSDPNASFDDNYPGGNYEVIPYITIPTDDDGNNLTFCVNDLSVKVHVNVTGGIKQITMPQESNTLDGITTAVYNLAVVSDREWRVDLLNYYFDYAGVRYRLFEQQSGNNITSEVALEGGNAALYFQLQEPLVAGVLRSDGYYTHYLKILATVVLRSNAVNPFAAASGTLVVEENVEDSLSGKTPEKASAALEVIKGGITNIALTHFANINQDEKSGGFKLPANQTNNNAIYVDNDVVGGILVVKPTPYYFEVTNIDLRGISLPEHEIEVQVGKNLDGTPITDIVRYSIGFTQLIYNQDEKVYQTYLSGNSPKMVSSWSKSNGYQWDGQYYFRTYIKYDGLYASRLPDGIKFPVQVAITSDDHATVTSQLTLYARYKNGISVDVDSNITYPIKTMSQTNYLAIGERGTYDITFPEGYRPDYTAYTVHGEGCNYLADISLDADTKTVSVRMLADPKAINQVLEIRIPYHAQGDFVDPYLSIFVVPVYFELTSITPIDHSEEPILVSNEDAIFNLKFGAVANYSDMSAVRAKLSDFVGDMSTHANTELVEYQRIQRGLMRVRFAYSYVNGYPTLQADGDLVIERVFAYKVDNTTSTTIINRTEYLPIGTSTTFDLDVPDSYEMHKRSWRIGSQSGATGLWQANIPANGSGLITVSLNDDASLIGKELTLQIFSDWNRVEPEVVITIIPVYFTFDGFRMSAYPVKPLVALTKPFDVVVEADQVRSSGSTLAQTKLDEFNDSLATIQKNPQLIGNGTENNSQDVVMSFLPVANNGILNFDLNINIDDDGNRQCQLSRNDLDNPITATAYLRVLAGLTYDATTGLPVLTTEQAAEGNFVITYFTVKTFGETALPDETEEDKPAENANTRVVKKAQAINTTVGYELPVTGVSFVSTLGLAVSNGVREEVRADDATWNATLSSSNILTVTIGNDETLFDKTLIIYIYRAEDGNDRVPAYCYRISPAWFSVDSITVQGHEVTDDNRQLEIYYNDQGVAESVETLPLSFTYRTGEIDGIDYDVMIARFQAQMDASVLITRSTSQIGNYNYLDLSMGLRYTNGVPDIISDTNSAAIVVQDRYEYIYCGNPPIYNVVAQGIGTDVDYQLNEAITKFTTFMYQYDTEQKKEVLVETTNGLWSAYINSSDNKKLRVHLNNDTALFGEKIRIDVYTVSAETPAKIIYITPGYYAFSNLTVDGYNTTEGVVVETYETDAEKIIADLDFTTILNKNYNTAHDAIAMQAQFNADELQKKVNIHSDKEEDINTKNAYAVRNYKVTSSNRGEPWKIDLTVDVYLHYENGYPIIVKHPTFGAAENNGTTAGEPTADFYGSTYDDYYDAPEKWTALKISSTLQLTVCQPGTYLPNYDEIPTGPRTRTEYQAIGTTARYRIDLPNYILSSKVLQGEGYSTSWDGDDLLVTLDPDVNLVYDTIPLRLYSVFSLANDTEVFILTIKPVLFEITGFEVKDHPEGVVTLDQDEVIANLQIKTKHADPEQLIEAGASSNQINNLMKLIKDNIAEVNSNLVDGLKDPSLIRVTPNESGYLTVTGAINYSNRSRPLFCKINNYPLNRIESVIYYNPNNNAKTQQYVQALGTTEYYYFDFLTNEYDLNQTGNGPWQAEIVGNATSGYAVKVEFDENDLGLSLLDTTINIDIRSGGVVVHSMAIKPVYFVVEGLEVKNHPERGMWLLANPVYNNDNVLTSYNIETIAGLRYVAKIKYSTNKLLQSTIDHQVELFNQDLDTYHDLLEVMSIDGEYIQVRAAIDYVDGQPKVLALSKAQADQIMQEIFQYKFYKNTQGLQNGNGVVYPTGPRTRTVSQAVGLASTYTIDLNDLASFNMSNLTFSEELADGTINNLVLNGNTAVPSNDWQISVVNGNQLRVVLSQNADLVNRTLVITFSYGPSNPNTAFVLKVKPVWFKVVDIAMPEHAEDVIRMTANEFDEFTKNRINYVPVVEYCPGLTATDGTTVESLVQDFTTQFITGVTSVNYSTDATHHYFQASTYITYIYPDADAIDTKKYGVALSGSAADHLTHTFAVEIVDTTSTATVTRTEVQAIDSTKSYYIDADIADGKVTTNINGVTAQIKDKYVKVTLPADAAIIDQTFDLELTNSSGTVTFVLQITPVWFEVVGFEVAGHPERPVWIYAPESTNDLLYRARINQYNHEKTLTDLEIDKKLAAFDATLNDGDGANAHNALLMESINSNRYIMLGAAIDYVDGLPQLTAVDNNNVKNLVEEVIEYYVWSDSQQPNPEHPAAIETTKVNQIIGNSKTYTLDNLSGKTYFQYIWLEGAGSIVNEANADSIAYEAATVRYDVMKNHLTVELKPMADLVGQPIKLYVPYTVTLNRETVWYSYCLEITPLLYEVYGWTIEFTNSEDKTSTMGDFFQINNGLGRPVAAKYKAKVNRSNDVALNLLIDKEIEKLEKEINTNNGLVHLNYSANNFTISSNNVDGLLIVQNVELNQGESTKDEVLLQANIVYQNGLPSVVSRGGTTITSQILVCVGEPDPWPPEVTLVGQLQSSIQAIGTTQTYQLDFHGENVKFAEDVNERIFWNNEAVEKALAGESDLLDWEFDATKNSLQVTVGPVLGLIYHTIEINIPYVVTEVDAESGKEYEIERYYRLAISPVLYEVRGFKLSSNLKNYVKLTDQDVPIKLSIDAKRSERGSFNVRTNIDLAIVNLETQLNNLLLNQGLTYLDADGNEVNFWNVENIDPDNYDIYVKVNQVNGGLWLQSINPTYAASHRVTTKINLTYVDGKAQVLDYNAEPEYVYDFVMVVDTATRETSSLPQFTTRGDGRELVQAVGTSKMISIGSTDTTSSEAKVFYFDYLRVENGGPKRSETEYENFDIEILESTSNFAKIVITLKASSKTVIKPIEVKIPYVMSTDLGSANDDFDNVIKRGDLNWYYYSLVIRPVLFEVTGWSATEAEADKDGDFITINDSAVELYFTANTINAPIDENILSTEDISFLRASIRHLEEQINTYSEAVADKYYYMVVNNTANGEINYSIFRDSSSQKVFITRETNDADVTVMHLSANVSYDVNSFAYDSVSGLQAILSYDEAVKGFQVSSEIRIITTQLSTIREENLVAITQDNANLLTNLSAGTTDNKANYILMSDIYLSQVNANGWAPAIFPENATLDGNNFKIIFDTNFYLGNRPSNIGLFQTIPATSVIKNLQLVIPQSSTANKQRTVEINLASYESGTLNIGMLAGSNAGIITNSSVMPMQQFAPDVTNVINPLTGENFEQLMYFNKDGYLFGRVEYQGKSDIYYFRIDTKDTEVGVTVAIDETGIYNSLGYHLVKNQFGSWEIEYDRYHNVTEWIEPDTSPVARMEDYCSMLPNYEGVDTSLTTEQQDALAEINSVAPGRLWITGTNGSLDLNLGGLVGVNSYMITNSRVLIDVELADQTVSSDGRDNITAQSAIVGGLVGTNSGTITSSYVRDANVINNANLGTANKDGVCYLGGFVGLNQGKIMQSYAMGKSTNRDTNINGVSSAGGVKTVRNSLGGFAHYNTGSITDCLVNMLIVKSGPEGGAGGFVYKNASGGTLTNCIENNTITLTDANTLALYSPFMVLNGSMTDPLNTAVYTGVTNCIYANNVSNRSKFAREGVLKRLDNNNETARYANIADYEGYSIGSDKDDWIISGQNTIWRMGELGPELRSANDIAVSYRKTISASPVYLYKPGTAKNPYLIWDKDQFHQYLYESIPQATNTDGSALKLDVDANRNSSFLRLVDNTDLDGIEDTYKITYSGTIEGNGLTLSGIALKADDSEAKTMGLFGKVQYATFRNINFTVNGDINSTARYVGGIAGIGINSSFVDVNLNGSSATIRGANIVGGLIGLAVLTEPSVENYNVNVSVSVNANHDENEISPGSNMFTSGIEYYQQALYARVEWSSIYSEQAYGTAGGIFGFITSNPNSYREVNDNGVERTVAREYTTKIKYTNASGDTVLEQTLRGNNQDAEMFLQDRSGKSLDTFTSGDRLMINSVYNSQHIKLYNFGGRIQNVSANVAGGLVGIMDETIELHDINVTALGKLTGKYYLGGVVGINLGTIAGGTIAGSVNANGDTTSISLNINSSAGSQYVYRLNSDEDNPTHFWGMTVGGVAGYNNGFRDHGNGIIKDLTVNVNVLASSYGNRIYAIGGIAGEIGNYAWLENVTNDAFKNDSQIFFTNSQFGKLGYYGGKLIGTANLNPNIALMGLISYAIPEYQIGSYSNGYVSTDYFATPNYKINGEPANAFGIKEGTHKIQMMTEEEYKQKIIDDIYSFNTISEIVDVLEELLHSLPTEIKRLNIDNGYIYYEQIRQAELDEFIKWIEDNKLFTTSVRSVYLYEEQDYNGNTVTKSKALDAYLKYIKYTAFDNNINGTEPVSLSANREQRTQMAKEYFAYMDQAAQSTTYAHNANFTWEDYETYRFILQYCGIPNSKYYNKLYGDVVDPKYKYNCQSAYDVIEKIGAKTADAVGTAEFKDNITVEISSVKTYIGNLYSAMANEDPKINIAQFSAKDPLQAYISYYVDGYTYRRTLGGVSKNVTHPSRSVRYTTLTDGGVQETFAMTLAQYYHFVVDLADGEYGKDANIGKYDVELFADYMVNNIRLQDMNTTCWTMDEYIEYLLAEEPTIMNCEETWLRTGHLAANGTRLTEVGGVALVEERQSGWQNVSDVSLQGITTVSQWTTVLAIDGVAVKQEDGKIVFRDTRIEGNTIEASWDAFQQYMLAKQEAGLDLATYKQIITLGGSLYDLNNSEYGAHTDSINKDGAARYLFHLIAKQYAWTADQEKFIKAAYDNNIRYAIAATYYGDNMNQTQDSVVALQTNLLPIFVLKGDDSTYYADNNGNGVHDADNNEMLGTYKLVGDSFKNGDYDGVNNTKIYKLLHEIDLREDINANRGAALFVDTNGDKMFTTIQDQFTGTGDRLLMYEVPNSNDADFSLTETVNGKEETNFYKISRRILETTTMYSTGAVENGKLVKNGTDNERSENHSDFLEEALWWIGQDFSVEQFEQIKVNVLQKLPVKPDSQVIFAGNNENDPSTYNALQKLPLSEGGKPKRGLGYTVADDWYAYDDKNARATGFGAFSNANDRFTTAEYMEIVTGMSVTDDGKWYSNYADYLLFAALMQVDTNAISYGDDKSIPNQDSITGLLPSGTDFVWPFGKNSESLPVHDVKTFVQNMVPIKIASDAMATNAEKSSFLIMKRSGGSTTGYVNWEAKYIYTVTVTNADGTKKEDTYQYNYRLNHYVYAVDKGYAADLAKSADGEVAPKIQTTFPQALDQDMRNRVYYETMTTVSVTDDLMEYFTDWNNLDSNEDDITFRDWLEWINVYKYSDDYAMDRGQMDVGDGKTTDPTQAWLTVDSYACWKRMQKYENNVEYANSASGQTLGITNIEIPILKRQISTTIFPKVKESGNLGNGTDKYSYEQAFTNEKVTCANGISMRANSYVNGWYNISEKDAMEFKSGNHFTQLSFKSDKVSEYEDMQDIRARSYLDRYEYNESYKITQIGNRNVYYWFSTGEKDTQNYSSFINGLQYTDDAIYMYQGLDGTFDKWANRYGWVLTDGNKDNTVDPMLPLDFAYGPKDSATDSPRNQQVTNLTWNADSNNLRKYYAQTYISFDTFKQAAKKILAEYKEHPEGYKNFMHYWAHNGEYNWIGNTEEYSGDVNENGGYRPRYHFEATDIVNTVEDKTVWKVKFYGILLVLKETEKGYTEVIYKTIGKDGSELATTDQKNETQNLANIDYFENYGAVKIVKHGWNDTLFWINYSDGQSPMEA